MTEGQAKTDEGKAERLAALYRMINEREQAVRDCNRREALLGYGQGAPLPEESRQERQEREAIMARDADVLDQAAAVERQASAAAQAARDAVWRQFPGLMENAEQVRKARGQAIHDLDARYTALRTQRNKDARTDIMRERMQHFSERRVATCQFLLAVHGGSYVLPTWHSLNTRWEQSNGVIRTTDHPSSCDHDWKVNLIFRFSYRPEPAAQPVVIEMSFVGRGTSVRLAADAAEKEALASGLAVRQETQAERQKREAAVAKAQREAARGLSGSAS